MSNSNSFGRQAISRRTLLKGAAGTGAAAAGLGALDGTKYDAVGEAEAIPPVVAAGAVTPAGAVVAVNWAVAEYSAEPSSDTTEGLAPDAAKEQLRTIARNRQSNNASTFIDNRNIIQAGVSDTAYGEAKIAAIESLNAENSQSKVLDDATAAINSYEKTVITNFLKGWNETVRQWRKLYKTARDHPDFSEEYCLLWSDGGDGLTQSSDTATLLDTKTDTYTFTDGTTFTLEIPGLNVNYYDDGGYSNSGDMVINPLKSVSNWGAGGLSAPHVAEYAKIGPHTDGDTRSDWTETGDAVPILIHSKWKSVLNDLEAAFQNARDNVSVWVDNTYGQVSAGTLDTSELLTASERAAISTDNSNVSKALADLVALNIASDLKSEVTINPSNVDAEISGNLGATGETTFTAGTTVDPSTDSLSYYFTYDVSEATGIWQDYQTTIDGGVITFTAVPYKQTEYKITTNKGETITVPTSDWTDNGDGTFSYDASAELETDIAEVSEVTYSAGVSETKYETILLEKPFVVVSITNDSGENQTETTVTRPEPHNDTNYITEEEWKARENRVEELIQKYEESQDSGGGGGALIDESALDIDPSQGVLAAAGIGVAAYLLGR